MCLCCPQKYAFCTLEPRELLKPKIHVSSKVYRSFALPDLVSTFFDADNFMTVCFDTFMICMWEIAHKNYKEWDITVQLLYVSIAFPGELRELYDWAQQSEHTVCFLLGFNVHFKLRPPHINHSNCCQQCFIQSFSNFRVELCWLCWFFGAN